MPTDQSLDEIRTQLDELEQAKVELERQLHERWKAQKRELAQQIREMIDAQGYDAEEIMALVLPRRRGRKAPSQGAIRPTSIPKTLIMSTSGVRCRPG